MAGRLFILSAPSGTGKTTVSNHVLRKVPRIVRSISATTRPPRRGERDGRDYRFVSREAFLRMRAKGEFLEWAEVHGQLYGTPRRALREAARAGNDLLLVIDVQGAAKIRRNGVASVGIFLLPPSWAVLRRRLERRATEQGVLLRRRLADARREIGERSRYDYWVVNDSLADAVQEVAAIITAERLRRPERGGARSGTLPAPFRRGGHPRGGA